MFIFVIQILPKKWNEICMKQLACGKQMENNCLPRTLKLKMESCKLSHVELNFFVHEKGLFTFIYSLKVWRQYVLEVKFKIEINHQSLSTCQLNLI